MMTRKEFQAMANALGYVRRQLRDLDLGPAAETGHALTAGMVADVLAASNPRFDRDTFWQWVRDVETGARDLDGRKV